jgi:hypothetical protein
MSKVALSGNASGTGTFTIASPNGNTDRTINLPDSNGTILTTATAGVPVNGPAFSAYQSTAQSLTTNVSTKILFQTEEFDLGSNYDTSTSRFTPTVPGYYQVNFCFGPSASYCGTFIYLYKNGAVAKYGTIAASGSISGTSIGSCLIYMNGLTDYLEVYGQLTTGQNTGALSYVTYFQAFLARSAT